MDGGPTRAGAGETRRTSWCSSVERTSVSVRTRPPSRGVAGPGAYKSGSVVRDHDPGYRARTSSAHGDSNRERTCTRQRGARSGTSRGFAAVTGAGPWLDRIGPMRCGPSGSHWHRLVARGRTRRKAIRPRTWTAQLETEPIASIAKGRKRFSPSRHTRTTARSSCPHVVRVAKRRQAASGAREARTLHRDGSKARAMKQVPVNGVSSLGRGHGAQALVSSPWMNGSAVLRASVILIT